MYTKISGAWNDLRASYWFIPALMSVGAVILSVVLLRVDRQIGADIPPGAWYIFGGGPEGARALMSSIVTAMISATSIVFSITIVALTLASGQFGSRLLRNFMRDRSNQVTLGTFIATFVYALLALRSIRSVDDGEFVPPVTITAGVLLVFASVGVLIYFIHHVAESIQADRLIATTAYELRKAIERLYPAALGDPPPPQIDTPEAELPADFAENRFTVRAEEENVLQAIDTERMLEVARKRDLIVELHFRPGDFIQEGAALASVWPRSADEQEVHRQVRLAIVVGTHRTLQQDAEFGIHQLVEIAVRALSTGINDPFTAMSCIDRLASALAWLTGRSFPARYRHDDAHDGKLRVIADTTSFAGFVDSAFNQIRQSAGHSAAVYIRLLEALATVASRAVTVEQRTAVRKHADLVRDAALRALDADQDKNDVEERHSIVSRALLNAAANEERASKSGT
ncbi:MAG: DUF2254 domain-containing protein [Gemmatimonadota bacterium]